MAFGDKVKDFELRLQSAVDRARIVLDQLKAPCRFASEVLHRYEDKYLLAESTTNVCIASQLNALTALGLSSEQAEVLREWAKTSAVSLRFASEERCSFLREESREIEAPTKRVEEVSVGGVVQASVTSKVVTTTTEYFWNFQVSYELSAVRGIGVSAETVLSLLRREGHDTLKTSSKIPPFPMVRQTSSLEVNISWLLAHISVDRGSMTPCFVVDRTRKSCCTPRRNPDVDQAGNYVEKFLGFAEEVSSYLETLFSKLPLSTRSYDLGLISQASALIPVLPVLASEDSPASASSIGDHTTAPREVLACVGSAGDIEGSLTLGHADINRLLVEEARTLAEKRSALNASFPEDGITTRVEATTIATLRHCKAVCIHWRLAIEYIEDLIRKQLIDAIGKVVLPVDFSDYMRFHFRKLFARAYAPGPFCYAVRRSAKHSPEGTVTIEEAARGLFGASTSTISEPIITMAAKCSAQHPMEFALSASANVTFGGERYLHGYLSHQFSGMSGFKLSLVARARQFSSMLVLVGRVTSASTFDPKYAAIIQNRDELMIPLDLSTIPTPKEFRDAIESLSPEQQAFAKAFRSMQLESTLFGILIIQIKPQLEKVLNLPEDSLTKEIKLTQELMQLFIKYQIPSDLLSFDGDYVDPDLVGGPSCAERLAAVKRNVEAMRALIVASKTEELQERHATRRYEDRCAASPPPAPPTMPCFDFADVSLFSAPAPASSTFSAAPASFGDVAWGCADDLAFAPYSAPAQAQLTGCTRGPQTPFSSSAPMGGGGLFGACPGGGLFGGQQHGESLFGSGGVPVPTAFPAEGFLLGASKATTATALQTAPPRGSQEASQARDSAEAPSCVAGASRDYTEVPEEMNRQFERLDADNALRPTIISPGSVWTKTEQKALLGSPITTCVEATLQKKEKDAAFDLLDALTKSGALPIEHAALHIVIAATHCFEKSVIDSVVEGNVNPIERAERSALIMASTIHQQSASALVQGAQLARLRTASPALFLQDA